MSRWLDNPEDELDDEEIARILQEEEYEIARQQQREAQLRQQQAAKQTTTPKHDGKSVVAPSSGGDEVLLLQSRCSAVSGSTVLNGSCYLYRTMFKFVCVERGKEVDVSIPVVTIEFISPVCAVLSKETGAVPGIRSAQGSAANALQLYTQDKRIHTFFKFADTKSFDKIFSILSSIHKNITPAVLPQSPAPVATLPPPPATTAIAAPPPMGMHMYPGMYPPSPYYVMPPPAQPASPGSAAAQSDFQQIHQQMARLQIQQPSLPPTDASGHQPPAMYYPYPPMATAAPLPPAAAPAAVPGPVVSSGPEGFASVPGALPPMPYYYYYPPAPAGGEYPAYPPPYAPYLPYGGLPPAYVAPPGQAPVQQQQQPQPPMEQAPGPALSGPPKEDLLA
jgi:hypothetical protein